MRPYPAEKSAEWYYVENNDSKGPFSESDMKGFIDSGVLTGNSFVWKTGMQDWQRLKNTELAGNETVHVEPSFSFTTGVVKEKSIGLCVVLSLVTCGIYSIYWLYTIAHDLNDLCESQNQEKGAEPGLVVVLSIVITAFIPRAQHANQSEIKERINNAVTIDPNTVAPDFGTAQQPATAPVSSSEEEAPAN